MTTSKPERSMPPHVLFVVYKPAWLENRVAAALRDLGATVVACCPRAGDRLPDRPGAYDGVVVGGGLDSMNASGTHPYMAAIRDYVRREVEAGSPYLGLCLGAQVLASAFGARVHAHPQRWAEVGYQHFTATPAGRAVFGDLTTAWFCHTESFEVPEDGELLATGTTFANQAFRVGLRACGLQFHPEVSADRLPGFLDEVAHMLAAPSAHDPTRQLREAPVYDPAVEAWLLDFLPRWLWIGTDL
jgi:GMP synthase (glutamine-hydrolysing)